MTDEVKNDAPVEEAPADVSAEASAKAEEAKTEAAPVAETGAVSDEGAEVEAKASEGSSPDSSEEEFRVPTKFKKIVEEIEGMSVLDLHELVKVFEKKFGVSAAAVAVAGPAAAGEAAEEKDSFTVELADSGAQKIAVIKVVKEVLSLGLKEAKDLVDATPSVLKEGVKKEDAEAIKKQIEEAGGKVNLK